MASSMTPSDQPKKRSWTRIALIVAGSLVGLCIVCAIIGALVDPPAQQTANAPAVTQADTTASSPSAAAEPSSSPVASEAPTPEPSPSSEPTQEPTPAPAVGADVQVGEVRWKVLEVQDRGQELTSDNQFTDPKKTTGKFVQVKWEMENLTSDMLSFTGIDIVDDRSREFKPSTDAFGFFPTEEACIFENINPNVPKTCTAIWELPGDATGLKLKVGDMKLFGGDESMINLGM